MQFRRMVNAVKSLQRLFLEIDKVEIKGVASKQLYSQQLVVADKEHSLYFLAEAVDEQWLQTAASQAEEVQLLPHQQSQHPFAIEQNRPIDCNIHIVEQSTGLNNLDGLLLLHQYLGLCDLHCLILGAFKHERLLLDFEPLVVLVVSNHQSPLLNDAVDKDSAHIGIGED